MGHAGNRGPHFGLLTSTTTLSLSEHDPNPMNKMLFRGTGTALVTPFTVDDEVDTAGLRRLIDFQIAGSIDALIILGTTGENPTVTDSERRLIVELAVETVAGRVPVIVGTGSNDTRSTIDHARQAEAAGADGQLVVGPFYNKPTQNGFVAHVEAIADASTLPMVLYNVPGRTAFNILPDTVLQLADSVDTVAGVKEASGNLAQISDILLGRPEGFAVYSGDDELALPICLLGGDGVISVIGNAVPEAFGNLIRLALNLDARAACRLHFEMIPAMRACFTETNPIPIKAVLYDMGLIDDVLRLPLQSMSESNRRIVENAFESGLGVSA